MCIRTLNDVYLHKVGDEHRQHSEREAEDVEERQSHKSFVGSESVVGITVIQMDESVGGKGN